MRSLVLFAYDYGKELFAVVLHDTAPRPRAPTRAAAGSRRVGQACGKWLQPACDSVICLSERASGVEVQDPLCHEVHERVQKHAAALGDTRLLLEIIAQGEPGRRGSSPASD